MIEGRFGELADDPSSGADGVHGATIETVAPSPVIGSDGHGPDVAADTPSPISGLDDVEWHTSYDRDSVDRFLADVEAEKARLGAAIAEAEARQAKARERLAAQKAYNEDQLGALVVSARVELDRIEKEHADAVMAIRAAALEEAARILDSARHEASAVGDASASLSRVVRPDADASGAHVPTVVGGPDPDSEERIDVG